MMVSAQKAEQMLQIQFTVCQKGGGGTNLMYPLCMVPDMISRPQKRMQFIPQKLCNIPL